MAARVAKQRRVSVASAPLPHAKLVARVRREMETVVQCPVCLDTIVAAHGMPCGHALCGACCFSWLDRASGCPVCRAACSTSQATPARRVDDVAAAFARLLPGPEQRAWMERGQDWHRFVAKRMLASGEEASANVEEG